MSVGLSDRRVVTFYSFKGGVGRSMALANVAWRLASTHGLRVVAVDWDLEAPGLHKFFGLSREVLAQARGVLDYLVGWREAVERNEPEPPDVRDWLLPVTEAPHGPRYGWLSLLSAGRLDESYDKRLASIDWQEFYQKSAGAAAVETLREQLVGAADVVLVDSRTGLTDAGGICTIQLPDAVVLMAAPNEQSLEGIERVARGIVGASEEQRAGRGRAQAWVSICRVPSVEETYLSEQWFKEHNAWFDSGVEQGLWRKDEHPDGLRSFEIPQRGRWAIGENLLNDVLTARSDDPLVIAYARLTKVVFRWHAGISTALIRHSGVKAEDAAETDEDLRAQVVKAEQQAAEAEQRGDQSGIVAALISLGSALNSLKRHEEALDVFSRAADIAMGSESRIDYFVVKATSIDPLLALGRPEEALVAAEAALRVAREHNDRFVEGAALTFLGQVQTALGKFTEADSNLSRALEKIHGLQNIKELEFQIKSAIEISHNGRKEAHEAESLKLEAMRLQRELDELQAAKPRS